MKHFGPFSAWTAADLLASTKELFQPTYERKETMKTYCPYGVHHQTWLGNLFGSPVCPCEPMKLHHIDYVSTTFTSDNGLEECRVIRKPNGEIVSVEIKESKSTQSILDLFGANQEISEK